jgi:hypothetical protein
MILLKKYSIIKGIWFRQEKIIQKGSIGGIDVSQQWNVGILLFNEVEVSVLMEQKRQ